MLMRNISAPRLSDILSSSTALQGQAAETVLVEIETMHAERFGRLYGEGLGFVREFPVESALICGATHEDEGRMEPLEALYDLARNLISHQSVTARLPNYKRLILNALHHNLSKLAIHFRSIMYLA